MKRQVAPCTILSCLVVVLSSWSSSARADANPSQPPTSPFGFELDVPPDDLPADLDEAARVGAGWVRLTGQTGMDWQRVEPGPGRYDWAATDRWLAAAARRELNVLMTVRVANPVYRARPGYLPQNLRAYTTFLAKAVERYDGDGTDDAPGSPVVSVWQIENEVDVPEYWPDSPADYAALLRASSETIEKANPRARVAIAGMMGPAGLGRYGEIMKSLGGDRWFGVFDLHWNCVGGGNYRLQRTWHAGHVKFDAYLADAENLLDAAPQRTIETWITEMSTSDSANPGDDQRTQAADLVRRYVYSMRKGVAVIFWVHVRDHARSGEHPASYFARTGLVDGAGQKKLSYYSYRLMTEKLAGCSRANLEVVAEQVNLKVYRFARGGRAGPVWVLWNDGLTTKTFSLRLDSSAPVRITGAVPRPGLWRGSEIRDPKQAFQEIVVQPAARIMEVTLDPDVPVYVELVK